MKLVPLIDKMGDPAAGRFRDAPSAGGARGDFFGKPPVEITTTQIEKLFAPIEPPNVIAIGLNYRKHAEEQGLNTLPAEPLIFLKATTSVIGPGDPIVLPHSAPSEVDYEAELAVVIGKRARNVPESTAMDFVLGFTGATDVWARDCQKVRDKQWARGKSFDTFCPLGPVIVTPDELDAQNAAIRSILNGRIMQESNTADMIFSIRRLISFVTHQFTLLPGTVILTRTPEGVGFARKPPVYLRPGDTIAIEIDGVGRLENPVKSDPNQA